MGTIYVIGVDHQPRGTRYMMTKCPLPAAKATTLAERRIRHGHIVAMHAGCGAGSMSQFLGYGAATRTVVALWIIPGGLRQTGHGQSTLHWMVN